MAVHELILLLCEIARDKWCSYWEHDPISFTPTVRTHAQGFGADVRDAMQMPTNA